MMCKVPQTETLEKVKTLEDSKTLENVEIEHFLGVDHYSQAKKALSVKSPFDSENAQLCNFHTLPIELSNLLSKDIDNRKKHRKVVKNKKYAIWDDTEEYFRDFKLDDIVKLHELSSLGVLGTEKWFKIPNLGTEKFKSSNLGTEKSKIPNLGTEKSKIPNLGTEKFKSPNLGTEKFKIPNLGTEKSNFGNGNVGFENNVEKSENVLISEKNECVSSGLECKDKFHLTTEQPTKKRNISDEKKVIFKFPKLGCEELKFAKKNVGFESRHVGLENNVEKGQNVSMSEKNECLSSGLEWLLGCKKKFHLTVEQPSKKRKLSDENKVIWSLPTKGLLAICDYCYMGENVDGLNQLIKCCSCDVTVHKKCYGVWDDVTSSWECDFCQTSGLVGRNENPCVLCPKKGGALKPVCKKSENGGITEFAHLFCCQWIPEVYIQDTRKMECVVNIEGISNTRMDLVCNVCKVKYGACVRCSNGTCRTSFHPTCAREAGYRMEIWGRFGFDDVELRVYCFKHSNSQNGSQIQQLEQLSVASCSDSHDSKLQKVTPVLKKPHILKIGRRNGDKLAIFIEPTDTEKPGNDMMHEEELFDAQSNSRSLSTCEEAQRPVNTLDSMTNGYVSTSDSVDYTMILKKLIDRGKANLKDIASEIGVSTDSLELTSSDNHKLPDLRSKIMAWLRNNAHIGSLQKKLKVRIKSSLASKDDKGAIGDANSALAAIPDVPVNLVSPNRREKNNIKILRGNKVVCSLKRDTGDELVMDKVKTCEMVTEEADNSRRECIPASTEKLLVEPDGRNEILTSNSPKHEEGNQEQGPTLMEQVLNPVPKQLTCSILKAEVSTSYIHPIICEKIMKMQNAVLPGFATYEVNGSRELKTSSPEVSSSSYEPIEHLISGDKISRVEGSKLEQIAEFKNIRLLETSPGDEVEGELLFHQHRLLNNAATAKRIADFMISEVVKSIPEEIDVSSKRNWDAVIVNQYMAEVKEARKQGRKERRHKEAQEVLSAATAAAAASPRISSLRKDTVEESAHQENLVTPNTSTRRPDPYSQQIPQIKETVSKLAVPLGSSEMKPGSVLLDSNFNKEHFRICDICRQSNSLLNPILVCAGCKVAVHLDCYRSGDDSTSPWFCELCEEELSSRRPQLAVECGLCGDSTGAFRKSAEGQWVHAFCAEWILEAAFRRGLPTPIEGMESVVKGSECHVCHRKQGVCIKCNYGHCRSMFHPSCARSAGLYMTVKCSGSKLQHKAYCQRHGLEQRAKAESQRHGIEELKSLKKTRVELERLRLLCERIIKREKLKRELVLCSQDILVSNRDTATFSALVRSSFFPADTSSESAMTSLRENTDDCGSGSEPILRSDDVTVDSIVPGKRHVKFPLSMDNGRKIGDRSTSHLVMQKPTDRITFAGKQIPQRPCIQEFNDAGFVEHTIHLGLDFENICSSD